MTDNQQDKPITQEETNRLVAERIRKLEEIRKKGINPYPYNYKPQHFAVEINKEYSPLKPEEKTEQRVIIAGRIMTMRKMGKASFFHIQDSTGKVQIYIRQDEVGEDLYKLFKLFDIGDIIGVEGLIFKTRLGEVTINAKKIELLCKSLRPLPEKYHGLQDTEIRYRKRYLDLIMNPEVKKVFMMRSKMIKEIRNFLDTRGFIEVETPMLQPIYGGASATPFTTHHEALDMPLYMKISPELYLKRLIVGGFDKVYDMTKNFRNEGIDRNHNPEFTMLEWYEAYTDYNDQMKMFENLVSTVAKRILGTTKVDYQGTIIDLTPPWKRISVVDALKEYADLDVTKYNDEDIKDLINTYNLEYHGDLSRGAIINVLFEELVEDKLIQPTFIIDHPIEVSPLTKVNRNDPRHVERFEPFICGMEVGNAYSELNDPLDQKGRLVKQVEQRELGDQEAHPMDEDFVCAIEHGMPPTGGVGLGVDRIIMILTNQPSIRDVIFFPTMKFVEEKETKK